MNSRFLLGLAKTISPKNSLFLIIDSIEEDSIMSWDFLNRCLKQEAQALGKGIIKDVTHISHLENWVQHVGTRAVCNAVSSTLAYMTQPSTLSDRAIMSSQDRYLAYKKMHEDFENYKRRLGC
jgi:cyanophycinase-like exopeptidase